MEVRVGFAVAVLALVSAGCETEEEMLRAKGVQPLDAPALRATFSGNTVLGTTELIGEPRIFFIVHYAPDGKLVGKAGESFAAARAAKSAPAVDRGTWRVTDEGTLCNDWNEWIGGAEGCGLVYAVGDGYEGFTKKGARSLRYEIRKGNPEKL